MEATGARCPVASRLMHRPKQSDIAKGMGLLGIDAIKSESLQSDRYVVSSDRPLPRRFGCAPFGHAPSRVADAGLACAAGPDRVGHGADAPGRREQSPSGNLEVARRAIVGVSNAIPHCVSRRVASYRGSDLRYGVTELGKPHCRQTGS